MCKVKSLHLKRGEQSKNVTFKSKLHTRREQWSVFFVLFKDKPIHHCTFPLNQMKDAPTNRAMFFKDLIPMIGSGRTTHLHRYPLLDSCTQIKKKIKTLFGTETYVFL